LISIKFGLNKQSFFQLKHLLILYIFYFSTIIINMFIFYKFK
jgi:hypothetical protein